MIFESLMMAAGAAHYYLVRSTPFSCTGVTKTIELIFIGDTGCVMVSRLKKTANSQQLISLTYQPALIHSDQFTVIKLERVLC